MDNLTAANKTDLAVALDGSVKDVGAFSSESNFIAAQRMAQALITSSMVPKHYQGKDNVGNAIIALEMSQRMGASPLMVMQNLYLVHGNPGWSAKFLIATFNQCGRFSAIRYEWKGDEGKPDFGCRAWAVELSTGEKVFGPWITWSLVKGEGWDSKAGSKWKTMPEKMFMYRAAAWMVDAVAPEVSMGLPTNEELGDVIDVNPVTGEVGYVSSAPAAKGADEPPPSRTASVAEKLASKAAAGQGELIDTATGEVVGSGE